MSGIGYNGKTINREREVVAMQAAGERESMWGPIDGEIVDYDPAKQTATIKPLYKPQHNGKSIDMPNLMEVPINFSRSGQGAFTYPMPAGTRVRLTPKMRSTENYHTADDGEASDTRSFALSDMEATIDGGDSLTNPLPNVDPANTHWRFDPNGNFGIRGSADGKIRIEGNQGDIYALTREAIGLCQDGFDWLKLEPALIHTPEYSNIADALQVIVDKLAGMQL